MKINKLSYAALLLVAFCLAAFAQTTNTPPAIVLPDGSPSWIVDLLNKLLAQGTWGKIIVWVVTIMGFMRVIFKPIFEAIHSYVDSTPSLDDNAKFDKIASSKWFKVVAFVLDWGGSIKLIKK